MRKLATPNLNRKNGNGPRGSEVACAENTARDPTGSTSRLEVDLDAELVALSGVIINIAQSLCQVSARLNSHLERRLARVEQSTKQSNKER